MNMKIPINEGTILMLMIASILGAAILGNLLVYIFIIEGILK